MTRRQIIGLLVIAVAALGAAFALGMRAHPSAATQPLATIATTTPAPTSSAPAAPLAPGAAPKSAAPASQPAPQPLPRALVSSSASSASSSAPQGPAVTLVLADPHGTSTFEVALTEGADACGVLEEAKREGKLSSLSIDDSYKASFGSSYVRQIDGFANDWTFESGGNYPQGCSQYHPKPGDTVVWIFGGDATM